MSCAVYCYISLKQLECNLTDEVLGGRCEGAAAVERPPKQSYPAEPKSG